MEDMKVRAAFKSNSVVKLFLCLASFAVSGIELESWVWWLTQVIPPLKRLRLAFEAILDTVMSSRLTWATQPNPV